MSQNARQIHLIPADKEFEPIQGARVGFIDTALRVSLESADDILKVKVERDVFLPSVQYTTDIYGYLRLYNHISHRAAYFLVPVSKQLTVHALNNNDLVTKFAEVDSLITVRIMENHLVVNPKTQEGKQNYYFVDGLYTTFAANHTQLALVDSLEKDAKVLHVFHQGEQNLP